MFVYLAPIMMQAIHSCELISQPFAPMPPLPLQHHHRKENEDAAAFRDVL